MENHAGAMGPVASATSLTKSRRSMVGLGNLLPPSPPAEKATASEDQARKASTGDGTGDGYWREGLPCEDERDELVLKIW